MKSFEKEEMGDENGGKKGSHEMEDGKITSKVGSEILGNHRKE